VPRPRRTRNIALLICRRHLPSRLRYCWKFSLRS